MRKIPLTQGKFTLVDDEDFEYLNQWKWNYNSGTARRYSKNNDKLKKRIVIYMHRVIMKVIDPKIEVDHINNNPLDNKKENLRLCKQEENKKNKKLSKNSTSNYKGVNWHAQIKKWRVRIQINHKRISLGIYDNKEEAAKAYNEAALKYHGEFACLNIIKE